MPVLGTKSPTPALPNLIGKGRKRKMGGADRTLFEQLGDFGRAHKDKVYAWRVADDMRMKHGGALIDIPRVSGMVVPQLGKLFTENIGHSGNQGLRHPAEAVNLSQMLLPRGGSHRRVVGQYYRVGQFRNNELVMPMENIGDMYEFP
jgi:hypothetical protein